MLYKKIFCQRYSQGKNIFYSIQYKNDCLAPFDFVYMFMQSIEFYTFYYPVIKEYT